jgi:hypothetical protein
VGELQSEAERMLDAALVAALQISAVARARATSPALVRESDLEFASRVARRFVDQLEADAEALVHMYQRAQVAEAATRLGVSVAEAEKIVSARWRDE